MGDEHLTLLARRGPDVQRTMHLPLQLDNAGVDAKLVLHGSVLSKRGRVTAAAATPVWQVRSQKRLRFSSFEVHPCTACI